jgi:hypothetical protein
MRAVRWLVRVEDPAGGVARALQCCQLGAAARAGPEMRFDRGALVA